MLTTIERTGRRMKISEKFTAPAPPPARASARPAWSRDLDGRFVLQAVLAAGDDLVAGVQALGDFDAAAVAAADGDEDLLGDELRRAALRRGGGDGVAGLALGACRRNRIGRRCDVDVVAVEAGHDRRLRQRDDVVFRRQIDAHGEELAGADRAVRVVDLRLHGDEARAGVGLRVDADDAAVEIEVRFFLTEARGLVHLQRDRRLFGDREVDLHAVEILQRDDDGADGDVLADVDAGDAERAGERRLDRLLIDDRLRALARRLGDAELGLDGVEVGLRDEALAAQCLRAFELCARRGVEFARAAVMSARSTESSICTSS